MTSRRARSALIALVAALALGAAGRSIADQGVRGGRHGELRRVWPRIPYPPPRAIRRAQEFAASRGDVSFAVIDASIRLRGYDTDRQFSSASVSKALLLAAELRRLDREDLPLDSETRGLLEPMVTYSDNGAADAVYAEVGDEGLEEVARRAGMRNFEATPGFWGGDQITAADMARFFYRLEANLPGPHRAYAKRLLAEIAPVERWGIPQAIGHRWSVWFKGGWRPAGQEDTSGAVTHQAALLVHRGGERLALAVLTDEAPGDVGGFAAIEGVTERLLAAPPPHRTGWPAP
jgi:beta-lactamase family protein